MAGETRGAWPWLGQATSPSPPWGRWSQRLATTLGLTQPERFSSGEAAEPLDGDEALAVLDALRLSRGPAGRVALAFGLPLALFGTPYAEEELAGLNRLLTLHEGRLRLALDPEDGSLGGPLSGMPDGRPNPWLEALGPDEELALALAGRASSGPRRMELLALLGGPRLSARGEQSWRQHSEAVRAAAWPRAMLDFLDELDRCAAFAHAALSFRGLAASIAPRSAAPSADERQRARAAAAAFLSRASALENTWEIQRWGVGEHAAPLVSPWFPPALVLQALHDAGFDQSGPISALLASLPGELRWYAPLDGSAPVWRGIPPDSDSLGLMLQLDSRVPTLPEGRIAGWVSYLWASLPADRRIPTWFYIAPDGGSSIEGPAWQFASNDCTSSRLTCLLGLLLRGVPDARPLVRDNLAMLLPCFLGPGQSGDFFYDEATADNGLLRLAAAWVERSPADPFSELVRTAARNLARRLVERQGPDGGWGSPQQSALRLEGVALWAPEAGSLLRGMRLLAETQRPDGAWAAEPLYLMPGKSLQEIAYHSSFELSTALCLRAFHAADAALRRLTAG